MSFWGELKRRNVYKVGVAYAIVAWLLIQFAAIAFPHLNFPSWAVPFVIVIFIIGFPLALLLAWAYEVTPEGIKRTKEVPLAESITHLTGQKLNYIVTGLLVLAVGFLALKVYFAEQRAPEPEVVFNETEQTPAVSEAVKTKKTIAVLPFENLSSDPEQVYFVDGLSEEILNSLAQISDLNVIGRTSSFSFKGTNKKVQEIANELGADNILEGSVRKAGNTLRITAQLLSGTDGVHLWSETYDRELKDIFAVQEDIAKAIAGELKITLGIKRSLRPLGGTENLKAYELYLGAIGKQRWNPDPLVQAQILKSLEAALALDPKFALAWAEKATTHIALTIFGPANRAASELDAALIASQKAIELEPKLRATYYLLGWVKTNKGEWIVAESAYRKALELPIETLSGSEVFITIHYHAVGYFKKAHELLEEMRKNDPLNQNVCGHYMLNLAFLGDTKRAEDEYRYGTALFGSQWPLGDICITHLRLGSGHVVPSDIVYSSTIYNLSKKFLDSPKEGLAELHRIYTNGDNLSSEDLAEISIWAAYFGDPEFAGDVMEKVLSIQTSGAWYFWLPVMHEVRQTPRFKAIVKKIGLVNYWNKFGWPDICHQLDNGDFVCD